MSEPLKQIPLDILFGNPEKTGPEVSPDGKHLAWLAPDDGVLNVWVSDVDGSHPKVVTKDRDRGVRFYLWAEDGEHILYLQDQGGNENWRLYATSLESGETRDLTPFDNVQAQVLRHNQHHPDTVLVALNKEDPRLHDLYTLDLKSGELTLILKNPGAIDSWVTDHDLTPRGAVAARDDGGFDLLMGDGPVEEWKPVATWHIEDGLSWGPVTFSKDKRTLYLKDPRKTATTRLVAWNLDSEELTDIAGDDEADIGGVIFDEAEHKPLFYAVTKARREWRVIDPAWEETLKKMTAVAEGDMIITSHDNDLNIWVIGFERPDAPVSYFSFDRRNGESHFLFVTQPALKDYRLAQTEPFSFKASDGLTIHGYLTFPPGKERKNLPTILNVHGGPWHRDTWRLHPEAQWMANRGYLCVQVNFRGSTGYGKAFLNAADKEWGGKMHQDLIDAVDYVAEQGYADPKRTAIYGGSYGGYSALAGATLTPDRFNLSIAIVGPSNLITFIETIPPYWSNFLANFKKRVGDPDTERDFLMERSPLTHVDKIKIPMMVVHGANDPRVKQSESEQIVKAMQDKGIPHRYMLFEDEGHGFAKPENRLKYYAAAEAFLAEHMG